MHNDPVGLDSSVAAALAKRFPGAEPESDFVASMGERLAGEGFHRENTLAVMAFCRDELARPLELLLQDRWGSAFDLTGLAGIPAGGSAALTAALHHAPDRDGRLSMVMIAASHVGLSEGGVWGVCRRPGVEGETTACGALSAVLDDPDGGDEGFHDDELDGLRDLLQDRARLPDADLASMAIAAADAAGDRLHDLLAAVESRRPVHAAIVTGVQIHAPGGRGLFWVRRSEFAR